MQSVSVMPPPRSSGANQAANSYIRTVYMLTIAFFGIFTAFNTAQALETNTVTDAKLSHLSLAVLYACMTAMSIVAPVLVEAIGPKFSMLLGASPYLLMVGTYLAPAPSYQLSIPAFAITGLGAALLWAAEGVYLGRCAINHASINGEREDDVTSRFNGVFYGSFQFTGGTGLIIASLIHLEVHNQERATTILFSSMLVVATVGILLLASLRAVQVTTQDQEHKPLVIESNSSGSWEGSEASHKFPSAIDTPMLHRRIDTDNTTWNHKAHHNSVNECATVEFHRVSFYATLRQALTSARMGLLVPIIIYNGMSLGFLFSDYRKFYTDHSSDTKSSDVALLPSSFVGFVTATFYFTNCGCSLLFGKLASTIGRRGIFAMAFVAHCIFYSLTILCCTVVELPSQSWSAYITVFGLACCFAIGDSVLESQIPAILQSPAYFPSERDRDTAISNLKLWQSLGFAMQFSIGINVDMPLWTEISILFALLILSGLCLVYTNFRVRSIDSDLGLTDMDDMSAADLLDFNESFSEN